MKNKIQDLNNHLFAQLERLSEEALTPEELDKEISRTEALVKVSSQVIEIASDTFFRAAELVANYGGNPEPMLQSIGAGKTIEHALPSTPAAEAKMIAGKKS